MYFKMFENSEDFLEESSNFIYRVYKKSIDENNLFSLMLSGGNTPKPLFKKLALDYKDKILWSKVHVFWVDERYVKSNSDESNYKLAYELLLSKIDIPKKNIHRIKTQIPIEEVAQDYEREIRDFFNDKEPIFDLILLGIGSDGHTASLFPNNYLDEEKYAVSISPSGSPKLPRITVTYKILNAAKNVLFIATYKGKEKVIDEILKNREAAKRKYPAANIEPKNLYYYILKN